METGATHLSRGRAFSLVELLIVIAVIAILAALLLPTLKSAQNQSAKAADLSNLREIITAEHVYTGDNNDILTWPNWDYGHAMPNGTDRPGWLYKPGFNSGVVFDAQSSLLWDSLHGGKVLLCPMDNPNQLYQKPKGGVEIRAQRLSTYIMNGAVSGFRTGYRSNAIPVKASQMLPADCILFEADDRQAFSYNDGSSWPSEGISARHSGGATMAMLDGASSYIRDDDWNREVEDPNKNSLWCYPLTDDGGDPVYGHN
jgi:prepilin-type N-terminal cleavage/methylation domain-containing protein/prepilin-type processing-associated H-X9-DG protein